jgi:glycerol-3-phosphate O-acyltransferase/dihydroxyacetone phosphate acyltransferase
VTVRGRSPVTVRDAADAATAGLARTLVGIFFRSHEVSGAQHVAPTGPLIMVANHQNGLVDGLVLIAASRRYPRFLGKSTLWRIPVLRPFLALAGVVPVYRGADSSSLTTDTRSARNRAALARCRDLLAAGGTIGVFPEGISHDLASLQELRTGAARLALLAATDGVAGVRLVPVGLVYDDKARFRSRVLVRFGPARPVDDRADAYGRDPHAAVDDLTRQIAADLRAVGPDYASPEDAERFAMLADFAVDPARPAPGEPPAGDLGRGLERRDDIARSLAGAVLDPAARSGVDHLEVLRRRYEAGLRRAGVDDAGVRLAVATGAGPPTGRRFAPLPDIAVAALASLGVAIHALPFGVIKVIGGLPPNRGMRSTVKLLGSFGLYNLTYLLLAVVVGRRRGVLAAVVTVAVAPLSGWVALRTLEEAEDLGGARRAAAQLTGRRSTVTRLGAERLALADAVRRVAASGTRASG